MRSERGASHACAGHRPCHARRGAPNLPSGVGVGRIAIASWHQVPPRYSTPLIIPEGFDFSLAPAASFSL